MKNRHHQKKHTQKGITLMVFVLVLLLAGMAVIFSVLDGSTVNIERDKKTALALAEAKSALLGFAARSGVEVGAARPGDLPCPDNYPLGHAFEGSSGSVLATTCNGNAIGRLPWKALGISDLRDGNGERLWYAVSSNFKNNPRVYPLNSDTLGTISLRDSTGQLLNDGAAGNGLVAVVFSPGAPLVRQDGVAQARVNANFNNPIHYLDIAFGEDNQNFINGNDNGFISGRIKDANGNVILNDKLISITQREIMHLVESRVAVAVSNALLDYYCQPDVANYVTKSCIGNTGNQFYPRPALFSDTTCFGILNVSICSSAVAVNKGRVPVTLEVGAWSATSILRGTAINNWFQRNGWREQTHYAVDVACVSPAVNCGGGLGLSLTLNNAINNPLSRVIVTMSGRVQINRSRGGNPDKQNELNYLEDENVLPLDDVFTRSVADGVIFNDYSVNIPQ